MMSLFGKELRKYCIDCDSGIVELAAALDVSTQYIYRVLKVDNLPTESFVEKSIAYFSARGVDASSLRASSDAEKRRLDIECFDEATRIFICKVARRLRNATDEGRSDLIADLDEVL